MAIPVSSLARFLKNEDGPTAVEYAMMLALIIVACIGILQTLGDTMFWNAFEDARDAASGNTVD